MSKDALEGRFARTLIEGRLLARDEGVLVAVSGGPDSVALLHLFCALRDPEEWSIRPHLAHLNHGLRGVDSDGDAAFVEALAKSLRAGSTIESADVAELSRSTGTSVEQAGREARFAFYERVCLKQGIHAVALAHHADDQAETVLHRVLRGTGLRGLGGMRASRPIREGSEIRLIRPLLGVRRAEIEAYLNDRGIAFRRDASNETAEYTRNRIRNELLPLLRERFNPQVSDALFRLAEQARDVHDYLRETGERLLESLVIEDDGRQLVLHATMLARRPRVIQRQLVRQAITRIGVGEGELSYGHVNAVVDLAGGTEGSRSLDLPGGLRVTRRYARLVFERSGGTGALAAAEVRVAMEGTTLLPVRGMEIAAEVIEADSQMIADHLHERMGKGRVCQEEWLDAEHVHPPLVARSRRPGDRFFPLGMGGMKKLSDFLIDEKVDADQRERTVVLCDQLGPIWIVPLRIDERVRLTRLTRRVLRLTARPIPPQSS